MLIKNTDKYPTSCVTTTLGGHKHWYQNGKLHRTDGPAVELADGEKYWYQNGERHRTDGPAIERTNGYKYWYQNGKELTESQLNSPSFREFVTLIG